MNYKAGTRMSPELRKQWNDLTGNEPDGINEQSQNLLLEMLQEANLITRVEVVEPGAQFYSEIEIGPPAL